MCFGTRRSGNNVASANRIRVIAETILTFTGNDEEKLVHHVMAMEWIGALSWRHDQDGATQSLKAKGRRHTRTAYLERLAMAHFFELHVGHGKHGLLAVRH